MRTYDPNDTAASISAFVNELARKVNRSGGYFDRQSKSIFSMLNPFQKTVKS